MKNWFKILKGEVESSSKELSLEIDELKGKKNKNEGLINQLRIELKYGRMESLAGAKNHDKVEALEKKLLQAQKEIDILTDAIGALTKILSSVREKEVINELKSVDEKMISLRMDKEKMMEKFVQLAGEAAGLWRVISGDQEFSAGLRTYPFSMTPEQRVPHEEAVERGMNGRELIPKLMQNLKQQRLIVEEKLPVEIRKSLKIKRGWATPLNM